MASTYTAFIQITPKETLDLEDRMMQEVENEAAEALTAGPEEGGQEGQAVEGKVSRCCCLHTDTYYIHVHMATHPPAHTHTGDGRERCGRG